MNPQLELIYCKEWICPRQMYWCTNGWQNVSAGQEHDLNTNQTSFTAGFIWASWETVLSGLFAMVTRDSFQRCHAALSSRRLIHSPPPSGSLAFVPFSVQTPKSQTSTASWKKKHLLSWSGSHITVFTWSKGRFFLFGPGLTTSHHLNH